MTFKTTVAGVCAGLGAWLFAVGVADAHPHVFAQARMEVVGDGAEKVQAVRNIWRMDEMFSTSVVVDYDTNKNSILDDDELQAVADTVKESIAEYSFYTFVQRNGVAIKMEPPKEIRALFQDGQLLVFFEMKPAEPIDLKAGPITVANFDETFFTAFDFDEKDGFQLVDLAPSCRSEVTVPDEDEAAQQWMASIASLGPDQTVPEDGVNYAQILATRAEIKCG